MTQAIILAAGQGTRLKPVTDHMPKCMIQFNGMSLLKRQHRVLQQAGLTQINVVTGYASQIIKNNGFKCVFNTNYRHSNMVESLFCAAELMSGAEDVIISYGDIIYESGNLAKLLETSGDVVVMVDAGWKDYWHLRFADVLSDAESMKLGDDNAIVELGQRVSDVNEIQGQFTGLIKISASKVRAMVGLYADLKEQHLDNKKFSQMYMTEFIQQMINHDWQVKAALVNHGWLEFDTVADLNLYKKLAQENKLNPYFCESRHEYNLNE